MVHEVEGRIVAFIIFMSLLASCGHQTEHTAPAVYDRDSASMMTSYGVNTLISDSGIIKYRIVAERWDVNTSRNPSRWTFICGIFMTQFDPKMNVKAYVMADTAWYYDKLKLWELRGRVKVINMGAGMIFKSEELFWDGTNHELYSNKYSKVVTPERTMAGTRFRSDENMERYTIDNSKGSFIKSDIEGSGLPEDTLAVEPDTLAEVPHEEPAHLKAKPKKPTNNKSKLK